MRDLDIGTVTVVGANGTMGCNVAAIFASFGGARVHMVARDAAKAEAAVRRACLSVRSDAIARNLLPCDYSALEASVAESDLVFESVAEDPAVKEDLARRLAAIASSDPGVRRRAIWCSGTSGLSITALASLFPEGARERFFGVHMFNPPYQMSLCELAGAPFSDGALLEALERYLASVLRRTVVRVRDTPAFLGNRIGFAFINDALQQAEKFKYAGGIDYIDAVLGPFTGRAMPPLATADFVGLDVHRAITDNILAHVDDPFNASFVFPRFAAGLVGAGRLGRKSGGGLYKTFVHESGARIRQVWDIESGVYRNTMDYRFPFVERMIALLREGGYREAREALVSNRSQEAELCCRCLLRYIVHSLHCAREVAFGLKAADDVMATGFNWCPPLALAAFLGGAEETKALCRSRLERSLLDGLDLDALFEGAGASDYDYRLFFKAKR